MGCSSSKIAGDSPSKPNPQVQSKDENIHYKNDQNSDNMVLNNSKNKNKQNKIYLDPNSSHKQEDDEKSQGQHHDHSDSDINNNINNNNINTINNHGYHSECEGFSQVFPHHNRCPSSTPGNTVIGGDGGGGGGGGGCSGNGLLTNRQTAENSDYQTSPRNSFTWSKLDVDRKSLQALCTNQDVAIATTSNYQTQQKNHTIQVISPQQGEGEGNNNNNLDISSKNPKSPRPQSSAVVDNYSRYYPDDNDDAVSIETGLNRQKKYDYINDKNKDLANKKIGQFHSPRELFSYDGINTNEFGEPVVELNPQHQDKQEDHNQRKLRPKMESPRHYNNNNTTTTTTTATATATKNKKLSKKDLEYADSLLRRSDNNLSPRYTDINNYQITNDNNNPYPSYNSRTVQSHNRKPSKFTRQQQDQHDKQYTQQFISPLSGLSSRSDDPTSVSTEYNNQDSPYIFPKGVDVDISSGEAQSHSTINTSHCSTSTDQSSILQLYEMGRIIHNRNIEREQHNN